MQDLSQQRDAAVNEAAELRSLAQDIKTASAAPKRDHKDSPGLTQHQDALVSQQAALTACLVSLSEAHMQLSTVPYSNCCGCISRNAAHHHKQEKAFARGLAAEHQ